MIETQYLYFFGILNYYGLLFPVFPYENIYSEIWFTPSKEHCCWPKFLNPSHAMVREDEPDPNKWKNKTDIDSYCYKYS